MVFTGPKNVIDFISTKFRNINKFSTSQDKVTMLFLSGTAAIVSQYMHIASWNSFCFTMMISHPYPKLLSSFIVFVKEF